MFYIYLSQSYSCYDIKEPDASHLEGIKRGDLRILKVEYNKLYGLKKDGEWKLITPGNPLRQTIRHGCPLVEKDTE